MANLKVSKLEPEKIACDAAAILIQKDLSFTNAGKRIDHLLNGQIAKILRKESFQVKSRNSLLYFTGNAKLPRIILTALPGEQSRLTEVREAAYWSARSAHAHGIRKLTFAFDPASTNEAQAIGEGALLAQYQYRRFKAEKDPKPELSAITICAQLGSEIAQKARVFAEANLFVRDLVNEPPNLLNPVKLAEIAEKVAKEARLQINVFGPDQLKRIGAEAFLSVGKGSKVPNRMIHLTYQPSAKPRVHVAMVGKGITFDSGGLSLKTEKRMEHMKSDMAGAATVLACVRAARQLKLPVKLTGILMASENMPGEGANRPGDIVRAMNGKTIEITNTDAEGRLALADGLTYAQGLRPDFLIDIATLTGAQVISLGRLMGAVMGNDRDFVQKIVEAGEKSGEIFWPLPLYKPYETLIKSDTADIRNSSGIQEASSIQAGLFLSEFVSQVRWAHLDIAGPSWQERDWSVYTRNASGFGARCLLTLLEEL